MNTETLERQEHYLGVSGPRAGTLPEIARWLLALALRRDGRADAVLRADEILASGSVIDHELELRERGAFAAAMYVAHATLGWPVACVARVFGSEAQHTESVIAATGENVAASAGFRAGFYDIARIVRVWASDPDATA